MTAHHCRTAKEQRECHRGAWQNEGGGTVKGDGGTVKGDGGQDRGETGSRTTEQGQEPKRPVSEWSDRGSGSDGCTKNSVNNT